MSWKESTDVPSVKLGRLAEKAYDSWRCPPPRLQLGLEPPAMSGVLLRQLGVPLGWTEDTPPAELLTPLVRKASERARRMAEADAED